MDEIKDTEYKTVTALGIDENIEGVLAYIFGILTGILLLLIEKDNKFVRFHAIQSIIVSILAIVIVPVVSLILAFIPFIGWLLIIVLDLGILIIWLLLMFKAYQKEIFKLPIIGDIAATQARI